MSGSDFFNHQREPVTLGQPIPQPATEIDVLRAQLAQVTRELDAAQALLASGYRELIDQWQHELGAIRRELPDSNRLSWLLNAIACAVTGEPGPFSDAEWETLPAKVKALAARASAWPQ